MGPLEARESPHPAHASTALPSPVRTFLLVQVALTFFVIAFTLLAIHFNLGGHSVSPVMTGSLDFYDFFCYTPLLPYLHSTRFFTEPGYPFMYPATGIPMYVVFSFRHALQVFLALSMVLWAFTTLAFKRALELNGVGEKNAGMIAVLTALTSYPFFFSFQRGNFETLLAFGVGLGTWAFFKRRYTTATLLWAIFGCIKLYPLLLLALYIPMRRFKQLALGIATAGAGILLALWYAGPTPLQALRLSRAAVQRFMLLYPYNPIVEGYEHSFFGLAKLILLPLHKSPEHLWRLLSPTMAIVMLALYFWKVIRLPVANQLLFLTIGMITLPPYSFDYTLLHLYAPWAILVFVAFDAARVHRHVPGLTAAMVLFAVLMTPQNFMTLHGIFFAGPFKAFVLGLLLLLTLACPFAGHPQTTAALWKGAASAEPQAAGTSSGL